MNNYTFGQALQRGSMHALAAPLHVDPRALVFLQIPTRRISEVRENGVYAGPVYRVAFHEFNLAVFLRNREIGFDVNNTKLSAAARKLKLKRQIVERIKNRCKNSYR